MKLIIKLLLTSMLLIALSSVVIAGEVLQVNLGREGQAIDLRSLTVPGSPVVVDFYSTFCPACLELAPRLERLAAKTNVIVKRVDINRPGLQGTDWKSPVARQFGLKMVPYLVLLDPQGKMVAAGKQAMDIINQQMQEVGVDKTQPPAEQALKAKVIGRSPAPSKEAEAAPPTMATVRKAKKAQGLQGYIFQDRNSKKFFLEDSDGNSYKFEGDQWVKLGGPGQPERADTKGQVQEKVTEQTGEADLSPSTYATVKKAKIAQGLNGYIFQDRNSGKWFLEDKEGNNYKFMGGQWQQIN
jgi:thiol-disulfide isomerase/thioredoxin